ncbi:c-type cytochrome [Cupriavidus sp. H18C2]|uniref:Cytochrome c n=1 Tax=Cupriavidus pauculus TaxID=82633 RepID=A0A3G8GYI2_9BURK|nr:cytochrome c [Cupriavidus pauculus]AZG13301.1 cytochrome c [Cupriavidus pauculus]
MARYFVMPLALAGLLATAGAPVQAAAAEPPAARQAQLARWLRDDCGACHGMTLQGGLGSPLTAQALAGKPRDGLVATVLHGRPGTAMPPWQPFMTQEEAQWLIDRLQAGKPPPVTPAPSGSAWAD